MIVHEPSVRRFFRAYPDGTLVSLIRDPRSWYASASRHRPKYQVVEEALEAWRESTAAALAAAESFGERVVLITYEELVQEPESTMTRLAERLGISMHPTLLLPTFNGRPDPPELQRSRRQLRRRRGADRAVARVARARRDQPDRSASRRTARAGARKRRAALSSGPRRGEQPSSTELAT